MLWEILAVPGLYPQAAFFLVNCQLVFRLAVVVRNRFFSATKVFGEQQIRLVTDDLFYYFILFRGIPTYVITIPKRYGETDRRTT